MKRKDNMPSLVYWGLYGMNSRALALGFMWLSVLLAVVSVVMGQVLDFGYQGALFLVAAAWYRYAINWVDKHSSWART